MGVLEVMPAKMHSSSQGKIDVVKFFLVKQFFLINEFMVNLLYVVSVGSWKSE